MGLHSKAVKHILEDDERLLEASLASEAFGAIAFRGTLEHYLCKDMHV